MSGASSDTVEIVVIDKVSEVPAEKIIRLGQAARTAHSALVDMKTALGEINTGAVAKLQKEMLGATDATVKQQKALASLQAAQARTEAAVARLELAQNKANTEATRAALIQQRVQTELERTAGASARAATARERLGQVMAGATVKVEQDGAAMVATYEMVERARAKAAAAATQAGVNAAFGIGGGNSKSARESMQVFKDAEDAAKAQAKALADLESRTVAFKSAIDPAYAAQQQFNRAMGEAEALLKAGKISQADYTLAQNLATAAMQKHTNASRGSAAQAGLTKFQMLTLQYTVNDVIASLASGASAMTILMQQGGQVTQAWGGLLNTLKAAMTFILSPIGLVIAAVLAIVAAFALWDHAQSQAKELQRNLSLLGVGAGMTAGQFESMADRVGKATHTTASSVRDVALAWLKTGDISAAQAEQLTQATVNFGKLTGESADKVVQQWDRMADQPAKFTMEFMKAHGVFTASEYAQIKLLEDRGDKERALQVISTKLYETYGKTAPEELSKAAQAWNWVKDAISGAWDSFMRFLSGKELPLDQQVAAAQAAVESLKTSLKNTDNAFAKLVLTSKLDKATTDLANVQEKIRLEKQAAGAVSERKQAELDGAKAVEFATNVQSEHLNGTLKLAAAMKQYDKATADAAKSGVMMTDATGREVAVADTLRAHRAAYLEDEKRKLLPQEESRLALMKKITGELAKEINSTYMVGEEREKAGKLAEIEIQLAQKKSKLSADERANIVNLINTYYERLRVEKASQALYEQTIGVMLNYKAEQKAIAELLSYGVITQEQANRAMFTASEAYKNALDPMREFNRQLDNEAALLKLVGEDREVAAKMLDYESTLRAKGIDLNSKENAALKASLETRVRSGLQASKVQSALNGYYADSVGKARDLEAQVTALDRAYAAGYIGLTQYNYGLFNVAAQLAQMKIDMGQGTFADILLASVQKNFGGIEDALTELVTGGKVKWRDLITSMLKEVMRLAVVKPLLGSLLGAIGIGGASGGGGIVGSGMSLLSGASGVNSLNTLSGGSLLTTLAPAGGIVDQGLGMIGMGSGIGGTTASAAEIAATGEATSEGLLAAGASAEEAAAATEALTGSIAASTGAMSAFTTAMAAIPVWGWAIAAAAIIAGSISKGETRSGGQYGYSFDGTTALNPRRDSTVAANGVGATFLEGPSGGDQNSTAVKTTLNATVDTINTILAGVKSDVKLSQFQGGYEASDKGRGGVFTGGTFSNGATFGESGKGDNYGGTLYEGSSAHSGDLATMFQNFVTDNKQSVIQAVQALAGEVPTTLTKLVTGIDAEKLTDAEASQIVSNILAVVDGVKQFGQLAKDSGMEQLKGLSFDTAAAIVQFAGGIDALKTNLSTYFDKFYSVGERTTALQGRLTAALSAQNLVLPTTRAAYRSLVEAQDLSTEAGQKNYALLITLSGAFDDLATALDNTNSSAGATSDMLKTLQQRFLSTNEQRAIELASMSSTDAALQQAVWALDDAAAAAQQLASATQQLDSAKQALYQYGQALENTVQTIQDQINTLRGQALQAVTTAQSGAQSALQALADANQQAADNLKQVQDQQTKALRSAGDSISALVQQLNGTSAGTNSKKDQYTSQRQNFDALLARALNGDADAASKLAQSGQDTLNARSASASSRDQVVTETAYITGALNKVLAVTGTSANDTSAADELAAAQLAATKAATDLATGMQLAQAAGITFASAKTPLDTLKTSLDAYALAVTQASAVEANKFVVESDLVMKYNALVSNLGTATADLVAFRAAVAGIDFTPINGLTGLLAAYTSAVGAYTSALSNVSSANAAKDAAQTQLLATPLGQRVAASYAANLGRTPELEGLMYWYTKAASGYTDADLATGIQNSAEYAALHGSHSAGLDNVPFDGYRAELHKGETVLNDEAAQMFRMFVHNGSGASEEGSGSYGSMGDDCASELQAMRDDNRRVGVQTIRLLDKMNTTLDKWERVGMPITRTA